MPGDRTVSLEEPVDCTSFRALIERRAPLDAAARAHAASCEPCAAVAADEARLARRLVAAAAAQPRDDAATSASLASARRLLARERGLLGALRARPAWQRALALITLLCVMVVWKFTRGGAHAPHEVAPHLLVFVAACALLLWPLGQRLPSLARGAITLLGLALPVAFSVLTHARAVVATPESSPWSCLVYGSALALPFLFALSALDRRGARGSAQALLAGAIAGIAADALLHLHCASDALVHLLLGHAPLGAAAALGALALSGARGLRTA
jgi:hypothetical protein